MPLRNEACEMRRELRGIAKDTRSYSDRLSAGDIKVDVWEERDRLSIRVVDEKTGCDVAQWWDDDARQMIEDGFFKPSDPGGPGRNRLEESVVEYLDSLGRAEHLVTVDAHPRRGTRGVRAHVRRQ